MSSFLWNQNNHKLKSFVKVTLFSIDTPANSQIFKRNVDTKANPLELNQDILYPYRQLPNPIQTDTKHTLKEKLNTTN